jgi:magnesium transporter
LPMEDIKVLGEFYFSRVMGKPIYDLDGRKVGQLRDMAVSWEGSSPRVTGIKYAKNVQNHIDINQIDKWDENGLRLKSKFDENKLNHLQDYEIYMGKWLLDKQIIDLKGSKLVRVNDIKLSWIHHRKTSDIILVAVDIGMRGLFRRLGMEFLIKDRENNFVGWQYIKPIENKMANLQLSYEQDHLSQMHPVDIAEIIEDLDYQERAEFIEDLDTEIAAEALAEVDLDTQVEIIENMDSERASDILEEMPPDEAADILGELPEEKSSELLNLMEPEEAEDVRELMGYPEDTAGALMTTEYIALFGSTTVEKTIERLRELEPAAETIYYLYVVDEMESLQGVLSLRDLIIAQPQTTLGEIMRSRIVSVGHHDDHEKVLDMVSKYNLLAVPVVDDHNMIQGIITIDDVLDTILPDRSRLETFSHFMLSKRKERGWND